MLFVPGIFGVVTWRFPEHELRQPTVGDLPDNALPDPDDEVLGRGNDTIEPTDIGIQIPMVEISQDGGLNKITEIAKIKHISGAGVDLALDGDVELVIVAMKVRAVAEPEDAGVLIRG
jgi:hypothetical protein